MASSGRGFSVFAGGYFAGSVAYLVGSATGLDGSATGLAGSVAGFVWSDTYFVGSVGCLDGSCGCLFASLAGACGSTLCSPVFYFYTSGYLASSFFTSAGLGGYYFGGSTYWAGGLSTFAGDGELILFLNIINNLKFIEYLLKYN